MAGAGPGIRESLVHGWPAVHLSSGLLEVTVLPGKGADIYALTDLGAHEPLLGRIEQELGPLAALVNVAGISLPEPIDRLT
ncbi:MAG TPA: hypothetical protein VH642_05815, partial [Streptosporangiaceae bacterium]